MRHVAHLEAALWWRIAYAGLEEKTVFSKNLSEVGEIPEEIVFRTCIGDKEYGVGTYGASVMHFYSIP